MFSLSILEYEPPKDGRQLDIPTAPTKNIRDPGMASDLASRSDEVNAGVVDV
jgi:hypothetical protein